MKTPQTFDEFLDQFKTFLVRDKNWSVSKAYHFNKLNDRLEKEYFDQGLSIKDGYYALLTGSGSD